MFASSVQQLHIYITDAYGNAFGQSMRSFGIPNVTLDAAKIGEESFQIISIASGIDVDVTADFAFDKTGDYEIRLSRQLNTSIDEVLFGPTVVSCLSGKA